MHATATAILALLAFAGAPAAPLGVAPEGAAPHERGTPPTAAQRPTAERGAADERAARQEEPGAQGAGEDGASRGGVSEAGVSQEGDSEQGLEQDGNGADRDGGAGQGPQGAPPPAGSAARSTPAPRRVALVGGTVHDFRAGAEPRVATVLIEGERVAAVGPDLELAPGTERLDVTGKHVVPGLIDGLASMDPDHDALYVAHGVTAVCDPGGDVALLEVLREPEIRDAVPGPALLTAGAVFDGDPPRSATAAVVQDPRTVEPLVATLVQRLDVEYLNAQPGLDADGLEALCVAARERGLRVWGQGNPELPFERLVEIGQRGFLGLDALLPPGVEWTFVLPTAFLRGIELAAERGVVFQPMLGVQARVLEPAEEDPRLELLSPDYAALWAFSREALATSQGDPKFGPTALRVFEKHAGLARDLAEAGVTLVPGSSAPLAGAFPGASLIDELEAWVRAGFTRTEALRAATRGAATVFGLADRGRIDRGARADLVVLDRDPRETLAGFRDPAAVVVRGRLLDRATLDDLVETVRVAQARIRAEQAEPIEIEPPMFPADAAPLMKGQVETRSLGSRLSSEVWNASRTPEGWIVLRGRLVVPASGRMAGAQVEIEQVLVDDRLESFAIQYRQGEGRLRIDGRYEASRFFIRRMQDGVTIDTRTMRERPALVNFSALGDSVTTAFVVARRATDGPIAVLSFGDAFEPIATRWKLETGAGAERLVRTHQGVMVFRYGPEGRLEEWLRVAGRGRTTTVPVAFDAFGGGGLGIAFEPGPADAAPAGVPEPGDPPTEAGAADGDGGQDSDESADGAAGGGG